MAFPYVLIVGRDGQALDKLGVAGFETMGQAGPLAKSSVVKLERVNTLVSGYL